MGLPIPVVRERLLSVAARLSAVTKRSELTGLSGELVGLVEQMHRAQPVRMAPISAKRVDAAMVTKVLEMVEDHPTYSYLQISVATGINVGRISEILTGKRGADGKMI